MTFSPLAAQHQRDLSHLRLRLDTLISNIAVQLENADTTDAGSVRRFAAQVIVTLKELSDLSARVKLGPDEPLRDTPFSVPLLHVSWHDLTLKIDQLRPHLMRWHNVHDGITRQLKFGKKELSVSSPHSDPMDIWLDAASDRVFKMLHGFVNPNAQTQDAKEAGAFADIPLPHSAFMQLMSDASRITFAQQLNRPSSFLDVGCGGGLKVLTAAQFFNPAEGLDFEPGYVAAATHLLTQTQQINTRVFEANGLTFDGYGGYDVIYFYRPMSDDEKLIQLEERIVAQASPGTLLIAPYEQFNARCDDFDCVRIQGQIFLAKGTADEAAALRDRAGYVGPFRAPLVQNPANPWAPIEKVLHKNGFL